MSDTTGKLKGASDRKRMFLLVLIPVLILFFTFNTLPLIKGLIYSFTNYKGYGSFDWVGLRNYAVIALDNRLSSAIIILL